MSESQAVQEVADPKERFDDVIREYIDFVNQQVGVYVDALAGFAGHYTRVERQVHRVLRSSRRRSPATRVDPVVWTSYEDPTQPDVIHNRIVRSTDYLAINACGGSNEQQQARATLVFLFTYWEEDIRPRLAACSGVEKNAVQSDTMGDLRTIRHAILHAKSILRPDKHRSLKVLGSFFVPDRPLHVAYDDMHKIFVLVKRDCARLMFEWLGVPDPTGQAAQLADVAIQKQAPPGPVRRGDVP
jgi:hypothetical protein